ncbi:hypothetical protein JTE90_029067 [Oedothorax gibbosus]|uniref:Uncharacterized protein n=1 Tax=Oedothorax gibbosus TaxID=931172 RepID=A0AAV6UXE5_9ARAC|nr:hypothetical protein JTE90_029067 [Oedothorax gibbosus]
MDTSGSSVDDQDIVNLCKELLLWKPTRCRGRFWCLSPETWLAFGFFLMVMGLSLLSTGCFFTSDADKKQVIKFGFFALLLGTTILIMLIGRVNDGTYCRLLCAHTSPPKFVGVCISPPIQPEFLSAMLLPEINREWVPVETLPGFERCHADIVPPPTQQATAGDENGEESRSKKRRNRKKKVNNSFSELDPASQESNEIIARVDANQEDVQLRNGDPPSKIKKQDFNKLNEDSDQQSLQENSQPAKLNPDGYNLNKSISQEKDKQMRNQKQAGNHQSSSRLYDSIYKNNSSTRNKVLEENSSDYNHKDSLQTASRLISKGKSDKPAVNFITDEQQKKSELALLSPDQNYANNSFEQLNITSGHLGNNTKEKSEKSADKTSSSNTTSTEMQQVDPKPVSPDFITSTSKKRNRRRKK